ncbi:hypothetical protein [Bacillus sp. UNC438CL73TsuS30]|uniref:hypothetical protein n=1 Tax=Bacillus sp. UNC438CL73TsuS30 TaxID=1340434 RepID=UPI00047AC1C1|nr:hypothetical protein [Bacillus sp. UNC438CL73TsuS30]
MEITKLVFGDIHYERGGFADKMAFIADKVSGYADKSLSIADKVRFIADKPFPKGCSKEFFKQNIEFLPSLANRFTRILFYIEKSKELGWVYAEMVWWQ